MGLNNVCRCCLTENCSRSINQECVHGTERENYLEMIINTFNITINTEESLPILICEECIKSLIEASEFKRKIESSEKTLLNLLALKTNVITENIGRIKQEIDKNDVDDRNDDNFTWDDGESSPIDKEDTLVIKLESQTREPTIVKSARTSRRRKLESAESDIALDRRKNKNIDSVKQTKKNRISKSDNNTSANHVKPSSTEAQVASRENSLKLIMNSNMCLFKSLKTKFGCFHCKESFMDINQLREHNHQNHFQVKNLKNRFNLLKGLSYKNVDISNLFCNICKEKCYDIDILKSHLINKHSIQFRNDFHFLIPYRLDVGRKCVICSQTFNTFTRLSIHMNSHYAHNVCEICGVSYINRLSLRMHVSSLHRENKCMHCNATFSTHYLKVKHMKNTHNLGAYKRYCLLCDKTFRYTYLLVEHKIQEHGLKREVSDCKECKKTFLSAQNLRVHIRSVHIKERNYPCGLCGMRFFTKCDQKRHEKTHEDVRSFECSYCEGRFKTKDSWRRHLKRQHSQLYQVQ